MNVVNMSTTNRIMLKFDSRRILVDPEYHRGRKEQGHHGDDEQNAQIAHVDPHW